MTWVKLCGVRTAADVATAVDAGADAVGVVIAARSPRRVTMEEARIALEDCPLERFLVTVDEEPTIALDAADRIGVTGIQPHGRHAVLVAEAATEAGLSVLFPIAVGPGADLMVAPVGSLPLFDASVAGSGVRFDLDLVQDAPRPFVIAGGLDADNVASVIEATGAYGVDVSSGIERERGVKDHDLMRRFVEAIR